MKNIATANYLSVCMGLAIFLGIISLSVSNQRVDTRPNATTAKALLCFADQQQSFADQHQTAQSDCKVVLKATDLTNVTQVNFTLSTLPASTAQLSTTQLLQTRENNGLNLLPSDELQLQTVKTPRLAVPRVATPQPTQLHSTSTPVEIIQELSLRPIPTPAAAKADQATADSEPVSYHF